MDRCPARFPRCADRMGGGLGLLRRRLRFAPLHHPAGQDDRRRPNMSGDRTTTRAVTARLTARLAARTAGLRSMANGLPRQLDTIGRLDDTQRVSARRWAE